MPVHDFESVRHAVRSCLESHPEILTAFIFGSVASGRTRPDSDIDVAVLVSEGAMRPDTWKLRLDLIAELTAALGTDSVDLIILNQAPPLLAHRVLSKGKLILDRSPSARVAFQVRTVNRYLDTQPMRDLFLAYLKKHVREGRVFG